LLTALNDGETRCVIRLEGEVDIASAAELKDMMIAAISSGKELQIDLEHTTDLDVAVAQLLWAAARQAQTIGQSFSVLHVSEGVRGTLRDIGLAEFPVPLVPPALSENSIPALPKSADDR
jgi:anti-anti-sigma factor